MLTRCFDAAYPPSTVPAGAGACLGYIGPDPAADHVWTPRQWAPFADLRQFPCWVVDFRQTPLEQARGAFAAMRKLGWFEHRAVVYDLEVVRDPSYVKQLEDETQRLGPVPVMYESESVLTFNGATNMWVADWNTPPTLPADWWAKQFVAGGGIDWSVVSPELMELGGRGSRQP